MYIRKNIQYVILEKNHTLVKFYNETTTTIYLKSVLKRKIKYHSGKFFRVKRDNVSESDFEQYLESLNKYCYVTDRRGNRVTLQVNNPF